MKALILFFVFAGMLIIIVGIYEQKLKVAEQSKKIEYKFVPRTYYEEQLANTSDVSFKMADMFNNESPWYDRTIGVFKDAVIPKDGANVVRLG